MRRQDIGMMVFGLCMLMVGGVAAQLGAANGPYHLVGKLVGKTVRVEVTPDSGFHINQEYPWSLTATGETARLLRQKRLVKTDAKVFTSDRVLFSFPVKLGAWLSLSFELKMSFCNDQQCIMKRVPLVIRRQ